MFMSSSYGRLDRFLCRQLRLDVRAVQRLLAAGRVTVNGQQAGDRGLIIGPFDSVMLDAGLLQARTPRYIMLNKPAGVVSATRDARHRTVLDLLDERTRDGLHIAGRLDFNSTGLMLLSNNGRWSSALSDPHHHVSKRYRVTVDTALTPDDVEAFAAGMVFSYEGIVTRPALLRIIGEREAEVSLTEGRYHQIRRMFARLHKRVLSLHRCAIGAIELDPSLLPGQSRALTPQELLASQRSLP